MKFRNALKPLQIFGIGLLAGAGIISAIAFTNDDENKAMKVEDGRVQYQWYAPELPSKMSFAGEEVPLNQPQIRELLDKQLMSNAFYHSHTFRILKLKDKIFPILEKKLKENGIPDDFKYLCVAESSLENPTSPAGAKGYWQFMNGTAPQFGLEVTKEVDERYHLEKSTDAACKYLKSAYNKFGSWTAAAASYNMGMGGLNSRISTQLSSNYYDLVLPDETNNYIFRILALKEIIGNPEKYGFHVSSNEAYRQMPFQNVTITETIPDLATFAKRHSTSYKTLIYLNPWLRSNSLTVSAGKSYVIKVPTQA